MRLFRPLVEFAASRLRGLAQRAITSLPWDRGGPLSPSRVSAEQALSLIPFFACIRLLAEQISSLPLQTFRREGDVRRRITDSQLVADPAAVVDPVTWKRQCVISLAFRGNAVGWITGFDGMGHPTGLEWLHPDEVFVDETRPTQPQWYWRGQPVPRERIVHIAWFVEPGKVWGLSPVAAFASSIGVGLKTTKYGESWFDNGGTPPGVFRNSEQKINQAEADTISERLVSAVRRRRPIVYGKDWEFTALKVTPEESQFIQTAKLNATQMAAIFGVPPEMVGGETGGSLTYNNPEMNGRALLKFTLRPWLTLIESAISRLLPQPRYVRFNADAVVRADLKTRYDSYKVAIDSGFLTLDEVRELEELPPLARRTEPAPSDPVRVPEQQPGSRVIVLQELETGHEPGSQNGHRPHAVAYSS